MRFSVARGVEALGAALDAMRGIDPTELTDGELADSIREVYVAEQRLAAVRARLLGEFDARGACREAGALTTKAWLEHTLRMSPGDALIARRAGRTVRELPALAEAFAAGQTTARHVDLVGRAVGKHGAERVSEFEQALLPIATKERPQDLKVVLTRVDEMFDPDGASEAEMRRQASRPIRFTETIDGMWHVEGLFTGEDMEAVHGVVMPPAKPVTEPDGTPDLRSVGERNADALVEA